MVGLTSSWAELEQIFQFRADLGQVQIYLALGFEVIIIFQVLVIFCAHFYFYGCFLKLFDFYCTVLLHQKVR